MEYGEIPLHCWSLRKQKMISCCPRSALLFYRDAGAGADADSAAPEERYLHALKNRFTRGGYIHHLFAAAMRKLFYRIPAEDIDGSEPPLIQDALFSQVSRKLEQDWNNMLTGAYEKDHKLPVITDLFKSGTSPAELISSLRQEIAEKCRALENGAWHQLQNVPPHSRRPIAAPLIVHINELCCCCAPLCALERNGTLWIIETGSNADDRVALLHKFYACNIRGYTPERVRSFILDLRSGDFQEFGLTLDISQALRRISDDTLRWQELLSCHGDELPFSVEKCPECRFKSFCERDRRIIKI